MKAAVVNRAPVMSAWATIVAERMGFRREEALSIGKYAVALIMAFLALKKFKLRHIQK